MNSPFPLSFRETVEQADTRRIRQLVASTGYFSETEIDIAVELVEEFLAKGPASGYLFLFAEQTSGTDSTVVGYVCYGEIPCTMGSYDIYWVAVDPACQGQGIGKRLLHETEQRMRQLAGRHVYAETSGRPQYANTRQFYEHCGYEVASELLDFYGPGDSRVTFCKKLTQS